MAKHLDQYEAFCQFLTIYNKGYFLLKRENNILKFINNSQRENKGNRYREEGLDKINDLNYHKIW